MQNLGVEVGDRAALDLDSPTAQDQLVQLPAGIGPVHAALGADLLSGKAVEPGQDPLPVHPFAEPQQALPNPLDPPHVLFPPRFTHL